MTKTTIGNYQERAFRTFPDLGSKAANGAHMALGIITELGEMFEGIEKADPVNIKEEHGDCNWYVANLCNLYDIPSFPSLLHLANTEKDVPKFKLQDFVDLHKKEFAYKKEISPSDLETQLVSLLALLLETAKTFKFLYLDSLRINIDKLVQRYPEKFSEESALNRDLEKERKILEDN